MKLLLALFLIIIRIFVGFKILYWLVQESKYPELHSISDIEFYVVFLIFDIWISLSHIGIETPKDN
jgi:hypothetical protein